jgi:hypothetical protein
MPDCPGQATHLAWILLNLETISLIAEVIPDPSCSRNPKGDEPMSKKHASPVHTASSHPTNEPKPDSASVLAKPSPNDKPPSQEAVRLCAYQRWETAGKPGGNGINFWLEAEQELSHIK